MCFSARIPLLFALLYLGGCSSEPGGVVDLPLQGEAAPRWVGEWYGGEGRLLASIQPGENSYQARFWGFGEHYRPVAARAREDGIAVTLETPGGLRAVELEALVASDPDLLPPGADACLAANSYWLFRDPSVAWIVEGKARRRLRSTMRAAGSWIDWLVRRL